MDYIKFLLDPMEDIRLTNTHLDYDAWHYMVMLEYAMQNNMVGFQLSNEMKGYYEGCTPRRYITEQYSSAIMKAIDQQPPFLNWINNYANKPTEFNEITSGKMGCEMRVGKDGEGWLAQIFWLGHVVGAMRFDAKAPPPPGWKV